MNELFTLATNTTLTIIPVKKRFSHTLGRCEECSKECNVNTNTYTRWIGHILKH